MDKPEGIASYILHLKGDKLWEMGEQRTLEVIWDGNQKEPEPEEEILEEKPQSDESDDEMLMQFAKTKKRKGNNKKSKKSKNTGFSDDD